MKKTYVLLRKSVNNGFWCGELANCLRFFFGDIPLRNLKVLSVKRRL